MPNLVEIGPVDLKRGFLNIFNIILLFSFYLHFKKGKVLHLNKLESPPLKNVLCQVWLKLSCSELEDFYKYFQYHFTILLLSPLGKGCDPSFEQT